MKRINLFFVLLALVMAFAVAAPLVAYSPGAPPVVALEAAIGTPEMYASTVTPSKIEAIVASLDSAGADCSISAPGDYYYTASPRHMLAGLMRGVVDFFSTASTNIAKDMRLNVGKPARLVYMARDQTFPS